ncbi:MAG: lipoyl domain-containing protein [Candidatus Bipolaricaulota bacterium]|nr:MAG: lipoyl domain-containing protein [Candidatus Bipolaricaulota bacterium]
MVDVRLPDLGEVDEVRLVAWCVAVGETVEAGAELVEVETEKATFVVEAEIAGRLVEACFAAGEPVPADAVLGRIEVHEG